PGHWAPAQRPEGVALFKEYGEQKHRSKRDKRDTEVERQDGLGLGPHDGHGTEGSLQEKKQQSEGNEDPDFPVLLEPPPQKDRHGDDQDALDARNDTVGKLDQRLALPCRKQLPVAQGPRVAATVS